MIEDFLGFLEYYSCIRLQPSDISALPYDDPHIRVEYDAINRNGEATTAVITPFAHTVNLLCYREPDKESHYNQKNISQICRVSAAEVTAWKKEQRFPEKYRWFLLLVDISHNAKNEDADGRTLLHTKYQEDADNICDVYLRMIKSSFDPWCEDDCILSVAVRTGCGIDKIKSELLFINEEFWSKIL